MDRRSFFAALAGIPFLRWLKPKVGDPVVITEGLGRGRLKCVPPRRVVMTQLYYGPGPFDIKPRFIRTTDGMAWERRRGIPPDGTVIYIPEQDVA